MDAGRRITCFRIKLGRVAGTKWPDAFGERQVLRKKEGPSTSAGRGLKEVHRNQRGEAVGRNTLY
jgi:hypothetical protein